MNAIQSNSDFNSVSLQLENEPIETLLYIVVICQLLINLLNQSTLLSQRQFSRSESHFLKFVSF